MLQITIPPATVEEYNEEKNEFVYTEVSSAQTLNLEHSLISLSKWESKYHKPFLAKGEKTLEETIDYIKFMTITKNVDPDVYKRMSRENLDAINQYIADPMTATTVPEDKSGKFNRETVTSELIYYWMFSLQIPIELERWHLNRLLTLIRVFGFKNQPPKKRSRSEIMSQNAAINAARRKALNSKG